MLTAFSAGGAGALIFLMNNLQMIGFLVYTNTYIPYNAEVILKSLDAFNIMNILPNPG